MIPALVCPVCGTEFVPKRSNQRFDTPVCQRKFYKRGPSAAAIEAHILRVQRDAAGVRDRRRDEIAGALRDRERTVRAQWREQHGNAEL